MGQQLLQDAMLHASANQDSLIILQGGVKQVAVANTRHPAHAAFNHDSHEHIMPSCTDICH